MKVFAFLQINSFEISLIAGKFLSGGKRKGRREETGGETPRLYSIYRH